MTDYGHDLLFGSFITPTNAAPQRVVELAQLSERAGLDLVTFQDHPYQPAFLDTWTLLSYVAARTERIRLAGNVLNLPLRPPAVLARAAASLDLLSGGRLELGLGAGGFWDAIEAMGGRRLTPGQSVDALGEAIDIIRGIWDTSTRDRLVVDGAYYRVDGAKRGPAPAHDIGIWLGAYKPRMLRLTGAQGRRVAALAALPRRPAGPRRRQRRHRRGRHGGRARPAGGAPAPQRRRPAHAQDGHRLLVGAAGAVGRAARRAHPRARRQRLHPHGRRPRRGRALFGQEVAPAVRELVAAERAAAAR